MGRGSLCLLFFALFFMLVSLGLTLASIVTDFWYTVDATAATNRTVQTIFSYNFGMWRKCYTYSIPDSVPVDRRTGMCGYTYQDLIPVREDTRTFEEKRYLHLERSWLGCMMACAAVQVFGVLTLICGLWPADCKSLKKSSLYLVSAILCLIAGMCGIASGICFIALRDIDIFTHVIYPSHVTYSYGWSFALGWGGTGLCILEGFIFLCLLRSDYININETRKYNSFG
ncbi:transmembrane protein 178B-like [Ylistrum balloti]|uniref:transmembrane protein 178B-like n=1 Tax=Ylistrum balloti TaxID=509963 RepID=UPI002905B3BC|nr:transmembrane protein 178B-like [Ylistrum balloti]